MTHYLKSKLSLLLVFVLSIGFVSAFIVATPNASAAGCQDASIGFGESYGTRIFSPGQFCLYSRGSKFIFQSDGNLVHYLGSTVKFASNTAGRVGTNGSLKLGKGGNIGVYNGNNQLLWSSNSSVGSGNFSLALSTGTGGNGAAYLYSYARQTTVWKSY